MSGARRPILLLFDVDGTLTRTHEADLLAVGSAFGSAFGFPLTHDDWDAYPHVTDSGIVDWEVRRRHGRPPTPGERARFARALGEELQRLHARRPEWFRAVPGAGRALRLAGVPGYRVAFASGCLEVSARFKLRAAGLEADPDTRRIEGAWAGDGISREEILRCAVRRARAAAGTGFGHVLSIGDGPWDLRTAAKLGFDFLGVDAGSTGRLGAAGAADIVADLTKLDKWLRNRYGDPSFRPNRLDK